MWLPPLHAVPSAEIGMTTIRERERRERDRDDGLEGLKEFTSPSFPSSPSPRTAVQQLSRLTASSSPFPSSFPWRALSWSKFKTYRIRMLTILMIMSMVGWILFNYSLVARSHSVIRGYENEIAYVARTWIRCFSSTCVRVYVYAAGLTGLMPSIHPTIPPSLPPSFLPSLLPPSSPPPHSLPATVHATLHASTTLLPPCCLPPAPPSFPLLSIRFRRCVLQPWRKTGVTREMLDFRSHPQWSEDEDGATIRVVIYNNRLYYSPEIEKYALNKRKRLDVHLNGILEVHFIIWMLHCH